MVRASRGDVRVGTSGWSYPSWRSVFYPAGLPQARELAFASRRMSSLEINGSFYSLQRPSSYLAWYAETPPGFVFAVKGGRFISHQKKLRGCEGPLANFFASGILALEDKLGPVLWQLPPQLSFDAERLEAFFDILPRSTAAAAELAARHDRRIGRGAWLEVTRERPIRYALEVRHDSYDDPAFVRLLRRRSVALCVADGAGRWPLFEDVTANFVYVRLHGDKELYVSGYDGRSLDRWAARVARWQLGESPDDARLAAPGTRPRSAPARDVYVYFDNDAKVHAPFDAMNLAARLGRGARVTFPRAELQRAEQARAEQARAARRDRETSGDLPLESREKLAQARLTGRAASGCKRPLRRRP